MGWTLDSSESSGGKRKRGSTMKEDASCPAIAKLPPFGPLEGHKRVSVGKIQVLPPCDVKAFRMRGDEFVAKVANHFGVTTFYLPLGLELRKTCYLLDRGQRALVQL
jgi:hypothetical protein